MKLFLLLLFSSNCLFVAAQSEHSYNSEVELQAIGTTNGVVPFWMRSNKFGSVPLSGASASFIGRVNKDYQNPDSPINKKLIDWGFGFEGRANAGKGSNLTLIEGYGKFRLGIFQLKAGRSKDVMGLNGDTVLSSGNFAVSGNALGIPKVEISIPEYWRVPIFEGLFSIKGNFVHGWKGKMRLPEYFTGEKGEIMYYSNDLYPMTYFHQKSLYIRLAKPDWKLKLYGGFSHQVDWGNEKAAYGDRFKLSPLKTFFYVVTGKAYGDKGIPTSKIGNQIGSIDLAAEYNFENLRLMVYRQNFYDVGALAKLANIADGLNGISLENKKHFNNPDKFIWKKLLFEFFYSLDQAGYPWSKLTKTGAENYYNNYYYLDGWSYKGLGLGTPLITAIQDAKPGQQINESDYFMNDRVAAIHLGLEADYMKWHLISKVTFSNNHGTFRTSKYGKSLPPIRNPRTTDIYVPVNQFSCYVEGMKKFQNGLTGGFAASIDQGKLLNNSLGLLIKLKKEF